MPCLRDVNVRNERGFAVAGLVIALFFFVLAAGVTSFELCKIQMVQREVMAICDAASLTGTAMLSSADIANDTAPGYPLLTAAQENAASYAQNMILMGSVLGQSLGSATNVLSVSSLENNLHPGSCNYVISLADPTNNYASVSAGNTKGKSLSCFMGYGYQPALLSVVGITTTIAVTGKSYGGLPQVDAVLVFDYSASMDDQTVVTFVRREWIHDTVNGVTNGPPAVTATTAGCGIIQYLSLTSPTLPPTIANYLGWTYSTASGAQGSAVNALPPQNLQATSGDSNIGNSMYLDLYLRAHYSYGDANYALGAYAQFPGAPLFRSQDYATPPGNCDLAVPLGGNGDGLTDVNGNLPTATGYNGTTLPCAFTDMTWNSTNYGYQPAAPGAQYGAGNPINGNDPGTDQTIFTDMVVNIANPSTSGPSGAATAYPYQQPINGPNTFTGFTWTFDPLEPDTTISGKTYAFPNIGVLVEAARGNLENTALSTNGQSTLPNWQRALLNRKVSINGVVTSTALSSSITPTDGYQKAYARLAMMFSQPIATAMLGADQGFYQKLHLLADSCFSFLGFSSRGPFDSGPSPSTSTGYYTTQGTSKDQSVTPGWGRSFYIAYPPYGNTLLAGFPYFLGYPANSWHTTDGKFTYTGAMSNSANQVSLTTPTYSGSDQVGGEGCNLEYVIASSLSANTIGFRLPRTQLAVSSPTASDPDQYLACTSQSPTGNCWSYLGTGANGIYNGRPESETDTSEALITARLMFHSDVYSITNASLCRPASRKIIVFFTDGEPTGGLSGPEATATQAVAGPSTTSNTCASDGIAIYTIGLNVSNNATLTADQVTFLGNSGTGLAALAGNSGQFFPCTQGQDVINAFSAVARRLTQGQR